MSQDDEAAASIRRERMRQGLANMWSKASSWADAQGGGDGGGEGGGEGGGGLRAAAGRWGEAVAIAAEAFHERWVPFGGVGLGCDGQPSNCPSLVTLTHSLMLERILCTACSCCGNI